MFTAVLKIVILVGLGAVTIIEMRKNKENNGIIALTGAAAISAFTCSCHLGDISRAITHLPEIKN